MKYFLNIFFTAIAAFLIVSCGPQKGPENNESGTDETIETLRNQLEVHLTAFKDANGLWGFKNQDGEIALPPIYQAAKDFSKDGVAAVLDSAGWKYIDTKGKTLIVPYNVDGRPDSFHDGLARFVEDDKFGYFDINGMIMIDAKFDKAAPFSEGLAAVCVDCQRVTEEGITRLVGGVWGYINPSGEFVIQPKYSSAGDFQNGEAKVKDGESVLRIDKTGKALVN